MSGAPSERARILLWGFMGSGKSTVGRLLAERASAPLFDLDAMIEEQAAMPIARLFERHGEPHFRALEKSALEQLLDTTDRAVVALGGGSLLDDSLRARALREAFVVVLRAPLPVLLARAAGSARPLLPSAERLLQARAAAYAEAHLSVDTEERDPDEIAAALLNAWPGHRR